MKYRPFSPSLDKGRDIEAGFTIMELLVVSVLGLTIAALIAASAMTNKRAFGYDIVRTRIDQNLRSAMDVIGSQIRVGGENLTSVFPAFEVINGAGSLPDTLLVRRNLIDEVLPICTAITSGSTNVNIFFAIPSPPAGCAYSSQGQSYNGWRAKRIASGGTVKAYVYNVSTRLGEFVTYVGETNSGTSYSVQKSAGTWANSYTVGTSSAYILEEWRLALNNNLLTLQQNNDSTNINNIASNLNNMQIVLHLSDGTSRNTWTRADPWNNLESIEVTLTGRETFEKRTITRQLSSRFFPRNILSQ